MDDKIIKVHVKTYYGVTWFCGVFGIQKFISKQPLMAVIFMMLTCTLIPTMIACIEFFTMAAMYGKGLFGLNLTQVEYVYIKKGIINFPIKEQNIDSNKIVYKNENKVEQKMETWKEKSGLGIAAFVLAIIGFMTAFLGGIGVFFDIAAIILAIISFVKKEGKLWARISAVCLAGISLIVYFAVLSGLNAVSESLNGDDDIKVTPGSGTSVSDSDSKTEASKQNTYNVGDIINDGDLQITVQAIDWYDSPNEYSQPVEGNRYIKVTIMAQNNSDSEVENLTSWDFLAYADDESINEAYTGSDEKEFSGELAPGKKLTGVIFYEVPSATQVFEIQYEPNVFSNKRISITKTMV
jgi:TM2 domain-containing membrane protein YozV